MFLYKAAKYINLTWQIKKVNIQAALEYRFNFIIQIALGMFVDLLYFMLWMVFFDKFNSVSGWTLQDTALVLSIAWFGWALTDIITGGISQLAERITQGQLDYYMLMPHNILWHMSVNYTEISSFGTIPASFVMFYYAGPITIARCIAFFMLSIVSGMIFYNFLVITQSIGFYIRNFDPVAHELMVAMSNLIFYPYQTFSNTLKFVSMFIIPSFFMAVLPAQIMQSFSYYKLGILVAFWLITFILALRLFNKGLQAYESGSLVQANI